MRLIDADALIEKMVQIPLRQWNTKTFGEALDSIPTIGGWISVKDRLPETGRLALVYGSAGAMTIARHISNNEWIVPGIFSTVTHWMPLPEPPKEGSGDETDSA